MECCADYGGTPEHPDKADAHREGAAGMWRNAFIRMPYARERLVGKAIIAACDNRIGAAIVGVRVSNVFLAIWIISSVLATLAGILIAPMLTLSPDMGLIGIKG